MSNLYRAMEQVVDQLLSPTIDPVASDSDVFVVARHNPVEKIPER